MLLAAPHLPWLEGRGASSQGPAQGGLCRAEVTGHSGRWRGAGATRAGVGAKSAFCAPQANLRNAGASDAGGGLPGSRLCPRENGGSPRPAAGPSRLAGTQPRCLSPASVPRCGSPDRSKVACQMLGSPASGQRDDSDDGGPSISVRAARRQGFCKLAPHCPPRAPAPPAVRRTDARS